MTNRAKIFTRSVSLQDHSFLKISARKEHPKWEIVSKGGFPLKSMVRKIKRIVNLKRINEKN
jgi:hypothetical protein